ncbi:CCR4-NOT transcription complex subunit 10 [Homalodisca vitripennis]|nr:CCR4-NOT transcription complex subunit 10 [Homalodisca vitripennis]
MTPTFLLYHVTRPSGRTLDHARSTIIQHITLDMTQLLLSCRSQQRPKEGLAHRVCLLLIELHLSTQQPEKALSLIAYIENQFVSTDNATKMIGDKELKNLEKEHQERARSVKSVLLKESAAVHWGASKSVRGTAVSDSD